LLNFSRIGITLIAIEHGINLLFHISRLLHFSSKNRISKICFNIYNILFVVGRFSVIILSIFVFWFGLKSSSVDSIDFEKKNFNTAVIRLACLVTLLVLQALIMWNFMLFQCKKLRETTKSIKSKTTSVGQHKVTNKNLRSSGKDETGASGSEFESETEKVKSH